jgi:hypothetical protein
MATTSGLRILGWDKVTRELRKLGPKRAVPLLRLVVGKRIQLIVTEIRQKWMTGGTKDNTLATRTGALKRSIRSMPPKIAGDGTQVVGQVFAGARYAVTHMGPKGSTFTIRGKPWLTIPMMWIPESARALAAKSGAIRGGARSDAFSDTFIRKSKRGNLIIFGQAAYQKGAKAGQAHGKVVPLFLLRRSVKVKRRVWLDVILKNAGENLVDDTKKAIVLLRRELKEVGLANG